MNDSRTPAREVLSQNTVTPPKPEQDPTMCNLEQLTTTDRLLLGQHVAVTAPTLQRSREYVTQVAQALRGAGHHVYHSISKVVLDNGGTLEALTPMGAFVRDPDHIVYLTGVPTGGTISRR